MKATVAIPDALIYEQHHGEPVYYRDYQLYLSGEKSIEEIMGSSYLQSWIISQLLISLSQQLGNKYTLLSNEVGIHFSKKNWRAVDLAIFETKILSSVSLENKYLDIPPKIVIEVDTKAALTNLNDPLSYYQQETTELLDFGVNKVIWIFTETRKTLVAEQSNDVWQLQPWNKTVAVEKNAAFNLHELVK